MWIRRILAGLVALPILAIAAAYGFARSQGGDAGRLAELGLAKVTYDRQAIPTIEAGSWDALIEAEGYVVASERMFQMDLMRRSASGRLAAWFGSTVLDEDRRRRTECWPEYAADAAKALPEVERRYLEAYARGVNRFIEERGRRWGLEYALLGEKPEAWRPEDSLLVLLSLVEFLASSAEDEVAEQTYRRRLSQAWGAFLFSEDHPWNQPMFGEKPHPGPPLPRAEPLPAEPLGASWLAQASLTEEPDRGLGSNNWAWCGSSGCFLANDPHLAASVPALWYAVRLRRAADDFAAGVSIPGLPGIVLGMNAHLAWAFTNVGEDVEDFVAETLGPDGQTFMEESEEGAAWMPLRITKSAIEVRDAAPVEVECRRTPRGPIAERAGLPGVWARRWLPFEAGGLRFPTGLVQAKSWDELNLALDDFPAPAQNVLMVDRHGNVGYRASGRTIDRGASGRAPYGAGVEAWRGLLPPSSRRRMLLPASAEPRWLATANERIWVDENGHPFDGDERKDRIRSLLGGSGLTRADMERFQRDTGSRLHRELLDLLVRRAKPSTAAEEAIVARWRVYRDAERDPKTFVEASAIGRALYAEMIARVGRRFWSGAPPPPYRHSPARAFFVAAIEAEDGLELFGIDPDELVRAALSAAAAGKLGDEASFAHQNRWQAQHPFAGLPLIGRFFRLSEPPQLGDPIFLRVETPSYGASVRLVYDLRDPQASTWSLPLGQSGHAFSPHFADLRDGWLAGARLPLFDLSFEWRFAAP